MNFPVRAERSPDSCGSSRHITFPDVGRAIYATVRPSPGAAVCNVTVPGVHTFRLGHTCRCGSSGIDERWDRLTTIPDDEIRAIETATAAGQPLFPCPYLKEGQRARVTGGPLAGVEGILVESRPQRGLLVLSVHLLQRSVAVVVD